MRHIEIPIVLALLASSASAQSLNWHYGWPTKPSPAPSYGAATGQAGAWSSWMTGLLDLAGTPISATLTGSNTCDAGSCNITAFGPDVNALFAGHKNGDCFGVPQTSFFYLNGLQAGRYVLTAMDSPCFGSGGAWPNSLGVTLSDSSYTGGAELSGTYQGSFDTMTLGSFDFQLPDNVVVSLKNMGYASLSAFQLAKIEPPAVFCTSKVNSQGCAAKIAAIGNAASLSGASPFHVVASDVRNDAPGLLFYGFAEDVKPFLGGFHCVKPPTPRTFGQFSGGNGVPCAGTFDLDFNAWLATGPQPTVRAGARIHAQYWYRDVDDPLGSATSDAVSFHVVH